MGLRTRQIALCLAATFGSLALAEGFFRCRSRDEPPPALSEATSARCMRASSVLAYEPVPDRCGRNEHLVVRDPRADPAGGRAVDILVVGDSVAARTYGWITRMATDLRSAHGGVGFRVANGAVPGYSTCQEMLLYRDHLVREPAQVVLLQTCANDLQEGPVVMPHAPGLARYLDGRRRVVFPSALLHSRILSFALFQALHRGGGTASAADPEVTRHCLESIRTIARENGQILIVVEFPLLTDDERVRARMPDLQHGEEVMHALLDGLDGVHRVSVADLVRVNGRNLPEAGIQPHELLHPNAETQAFIGAALARTIAMEGWLRGIVP